MILYSLADLDDLLPELDPDEEPTALDGTPQANDAEVEAFLDRYTASEYPRALVRAVEGIDATVARQNGARHPSLRLYLWQALAEAMVGAYPARRAVDEGYAYWSARHLRPGERRPRNELRDWLRWQVPKVAARTDLAQVRKRLDEVFGELQFNVGGRVDPATGEVLDGMQLPERFWQRPALAAVRNAALLVGVAPETLVLAIIVAVAAHIPHDVVFPGKRRGVPNLLAAILGEPGLGKGTALDRALELVSLPKGARKYKPGTAQGLVKQFYGPTTAAQKAANPDAPALTRHSHPVVLRVDEIGKFAAAAAGTNGQNFISEIKSGVFGEGLGQSVATDEKNLQCEERSYRLVGLLGAAPGIAGPLFDDVDGGLPQRLLFANLLRPDQEPSAMLVPFDDMAVDDGQAAGGGKYTQLSRLAWSPPMAGVQQSFADSARVAQRMAEMVQVRWDLLDAHVPYLTHAVAAVLAYLDGRWVIQPADLTLAGDVMAVSRATRGELLAGLARSAATGKQQKRHERVREAVETAEAVQVQALDLKRLDYARRIVAQVREWTADKETAPSVRDLYRKVNDRGAWRRAYDEAIGRGWLIEEAQETEAGGSPRRAVVLTQGAP